MAKNFAYPPADAVAGHGIADGARGDGKAEASKAKVVGADRGLKQFLLEAAPASVYMLELRCFEQALTGGESERPGRFSPAGARRLTSQKL